MCDFSRTGLATLANLENISAVHSVVVLGMSLMVTEGFSNTAVLLQFVHTKSEIGHTGTSPDTPQGTSEQAHTHIHHQSLLREGRKSLIQFCSSVSRSTRARLAGAPTDRAAQELRGTRSRAFRAPDKDPARSHSLSSLPEETAVFEVQLPTHSDLPTPQPGPRPATAGTLAAEHQPSPTLGTLCITALNSVKVLPLGFHARP